MDGLLLVAADALQEKIDIVGEGECEEAEDGERDVILS